MAKRKTAKKKKELTDAAVFKAFGVGPKEKSLRAFISSQRKINGRLYKAIEAILDAFPQPGKGKAGFTVNFDALAKAEKINEGVPGELPGTGWGGERIY